MTHKKWKESPWLGSLKLVKRLPFKKKEWVIENVFDHPSSNTRIHLRQRILRDLIVLTP